MNEISLRLDKNADEPLFLQLYNFIKQEITEENYLKNEKMPSKRQLANRLECSQNTVQAAYHQLVDEGYLIPRAKSGYYVAELDGILRIGQSQPPPSVQKSGADRYLHDFFVSRRRLRQLSFYGVA